MNLLDVISRVREYLEQNGRISYRMLQRQFELDDATRRRELGVARDLFASMGASARAEALTRQIQDT